ncbi:DUF4844 domain-containing protein [Flavobacterium sp.]|jgi:hypothetical protein|uniref:DUF4844 domain-containing protein n=1 Tax=Flavobacterium sp. TaxID=239 RepID=UPI0037BFEDD2
MGEKLVEKLNFFITKNKFSDSEWLKRGLNPSDDNLCNKMNAIFNECAKSLIIEVQKEFNPKVIKSILKNYLLKFDKKIYDTEEREFICDYFEELSKIVNVKFNNELNSWLYGSLLNELIKFTSLFKSSEKVIETLSQQCTKCKTELNTIILEKQENIPDYCYDIVKCKSCGEFNLIEKGSKIKRCRFENYELIEQLKKQEFNKEEAEIRLKQIQYFRK